ncbi:hypothetical protein Tco_0086310 [Tanacetum coccineum]
MPIPKAMMSEEIKESQAYANYLNKYPFLYTRHGIGKGLMRRSDNPTPKKKKDVVPRCLRKITDDDNLLKDLDEALEYAKMVSMEETQNQEKERQSKHIHARIMLEKQINKEVDKEHSSSSNDSSNDDKTDNKKESEHEETKSDSENGEESDKFDNDAESTESKNDEPNNDSDDAND